MCFCSCSRILIVSLPAQIWRSPLSCRGNFLFLDISSLISNGRQIQSKDDQLVLSTKGLVRLTTGRSLATWIPGTTIQSSPRNVHNHTWSTYSYVQKWHQKHEKIRSNLSLQCPKYQKKSLFIPFCNIFLGEILTQKNLRSFPLLLGAQSLEYCQTLTKLSCAIWFLVTASFQLPPFLKNLC